MALSAPWLSVESFATRMGLEWEDCPLDDQTILQLRQVVSAACAWIERQTGRRLLRSRYVRRFTGNGSNWLALPFAPVILVNSVSVNGAELTVTDADQAALSGGVYSDGCRLWNCGGCFSTKKHSIRVDYWAGYAPESLPPDIVAATQIVAAIMWKERERAGNKSITLPANVETYIRHLEGIDAATVQRCINWKELFIPKGVPLPGDENCELGLFELGTCELG